MNKELGGKLSKEYIEASEIRYQNNKDSHEVNVIVLSNSRTKIQNLITNQICQK